jgi:2-oxoacid:acceptor oxidoreductase gamma subunit (pyruvate/2-ketoisovalerate family)
LEREVLVTGIGGQGVQLASQVLARAALAEGREVQLFGSYGGMMRGGNTDTTLVIGDGQIEAPPTVSHAWSAVAMHEDYSAPVLARVRTGGLLLINSTVFTAPVEDRFRVVPVPATDIAVELGAIVTAAMVLLGAYVAVTGMVAIDSLVAAAAGALPSYRSAQAERNARALRAGYDAAPADRVPAWEAVPC